VIRHAEKSPGDGDVSLSEAGRMRAAELAKVLKNAGVDAIYVSTAARTQETAKPLATELKLNCVILDENQLKMKLKTLGNDHRDQVVLFVSHSNYVPMIIDAVTGRVNGIEIAEDEYDKLFVLCPLSKGGWGLVRARY
jgi:broad specificity phosphatase PhoE